MSFLKKLFRPRTYADEMADADRLFAEEQYGVARLSYQRALRRTADAEESRRAQARIDACGDAIAARFVAEAERLIADGDAEGAFEEIARAREVATSEQLRAQLETLNERAQRADARHKAEELPLSEEERLLAISGSWEPEQAEEYERYGTSLEQALLALYDERIDDALTALEALYANAEDPCYLHYEVGRARLIKGDQAGGEAALRAFLEALGERDGGEARLSSYLELATIADDRGDFEGAVAQLESAIEARPQQPGTYYALGRFLRERGHPEDAAEVLEAGIAASGDAQRPDWHLLEALGLAKAEHGADEQAVQWLERVVEYLVAIGHQDIPPQTGVRLAELHERAGRLSRAADLYSMLARGSDRDNHYRYHREGARLMQALGLEDDALRMAQRAAELAPEPTTAEQLLQSVTDERSSK